MYSTRQVADLVDLPAVQIREYARAGVLSADRDSRGGYTYSFRDLVILRTAADLAGRSISHGRLRRAFSALRRQLPPHRAITEVRLTLDEDGLVATDGRSAWDPESGQVHMVFDPPVDCATDVAPIPARYASVPSANRVPDEERVEAEIWFDVACELEETSPIESGLAYERALISNPFHTHAMINLGRLLHIRGDVDEAIAWYRNALSVDPMAATAAFNLGVALEDQGRRVDAIDAYEQCIEADASLADAHFNLGCLYERQGDPTAAIRHLKTYKLLRDVT